MPTRTTQLCLVSLMFLSLVVLAGCGQDGQQAKEPDAATPSSFIGTFAEMSGTLDIAGGTAHIPVMNEAAERIMKANPSIRITVAGGGSGVGIQKAGQGLVQIGNAGRPLSAEETAQYGLQSYAFAVDGVCAVVHPSNPVAALTSAQMQAIFAGTISNWQDIGGPDQKIHLFTRDEASGTRKVFWKKALAKGEIHAAANVVASNGAMKTAVSADPGAIGYVSIGHLDPTLKAPALDGVEITQQNASDGTYPVVRKLYMNTKGEPGPLAKKFIDFVMGPEGEQIVQGKGYLPVAR